MPGAGQTKCDSAAGQERMSNQWGETEIDIYGQLANFAPKRAAHVLAIGLTWRKMGDPVVRDVVWCVETNEIANEKGKYGKMIGNHEKRGSFVSPL